MQMILLNVVPIDTIDRYAGLAALEKICSHFFNLFQITNYCYQTKDWKFYCSLVHMNVSSIRIGALSKPQEPETPFQCRKLEFQFL